MDSIVFDNRLKTIEHTLQQLVYIIEDLQVRKPDLTLRDLSEKTGRELQTLRKYLKAHYVIGLHYTQSAANKHIRLTPETYREMLTYYRSKDT